MGEPMEHHSWCYLSLHQSSEYCRDKPLKRVVIWTMFGNKTKMFEKFVHNRNCLYPTLTVDGSLSTPASDD